MAPSMNLKTFSTPFALRRVTMLKNFICRCHATEPPELATVVNEKWGPLVKWLHERHPVSVKPAVGFEMPQISPETFTTLSNHLHSYNYWSVVGESFNYIAAQRFLT